MRYGINGEAEYTQREIAKKLGISRSYVSRIEKSALTKLKNTPRLADYWEVQQGQPTGKKRTLAQGQDNKHNVKAEKPQTQRAAGRAVRKGGEKPVQSRLGPSYFHMSHCDSAN